MEERETQARESAGRRTFGSGRLLGFAGAAALAMLAVTAAPAGGGSQSAANRADAAVSVDDNFFSPTPVTISAGETVTWTNNGNVGHDVTFQDGWRMPTSMYDSAWTVSRTFMTPGQFNYYCTFHGSLTAGMRGTVIVTGTSQPPPPPPPGGNPPPGGYPPPGGSPGTGTPGTGTPGSGKASTAITLRVSDSTPARASRVRFFGSVRPDQDGRRVRLQRRARGGSYRTIARIALRDAGSSRSKFSKRLRVMADAVFRARLPADADHEAGTSRTRRVNVP
jgi:plastocyanin